MTGGGSGPQVAQSPPTEADEDAFLDAMRRSRRLYGRWMRMPQTPEAYAEYLSPRYLKIDGRWRDHERWAIDAERWRASRRARKRASEMVG